MMRKFSLLQNQINPLILMIFQNVQNLYKIRRTYRKFEYDELLRHLFYSVNTEPHQSDIHEKMYNILERVSEIFYPYRNKKKYGYIKMACSQCFDDYPKRIFLEFYYQAPNDSTKVIQFSFYPYVGIFEISGRRIGFGERKPYVITYNDNIAYLLLEQRIKEIPCEIRTLFRRYYCKSQETLTFKNSSVPFILQYRHVYNSLSCLPKFYLMLQGIVLELSATLSVATWNKKLHYDQYHY